MAVDWYRRTTWGEADEREFHVRLARARSSSRAQYLRIQAGYLAGAAPPNYQAALKLLDLMLETYPDKSELSMAQCQKGECFEALGRIEQALDCYADALETMRQFPKSRNQAWSRYALLVAAAGLELRFDQALAVLAEFQTDLFLPRDWFEWHSAHALILNRIGARTKAIEHATAALESAGVKHSGFSRHPNVGLVDERNAHLLARVRQVAEPDTPWTQFLPRFFH